jgi:hypothetical protein
MLAQLGEAHFHQVHLRQGKAVAAMLEVLEDLDAGGKHARNGDAPECEAGRLSHECLLRGVTGVSAELLTYRDWTCGIPWPGSARNSQRNARQPTTSRRVRGRGF